jgi:hypothetical protein
MRLIIFCFGIAIIFGSCGQTPQKKAESIVEKYLLENLDDPSTYQNVGFEKLDTLYLKDVYDSMMLAALNSLEYDSIAKIDHITGYSIVHKYRIKKAGNLKLVRGKYYLDSAFKVTNVYHY